MSDEQRTEVREGRLEARAARAEKDLEQTVDEMERRIEDARDVKKVAKNNAPLLAKMGAATAGGLALAFGWGAYRAATADERRQRELNKAMKRMLFHPERVAKKPSTFVGVLKAGFLLGGLVVVVALLAKSLITRLLAPRTAASAARMPVPRPLPRSVPLKT